MLARMNNTEPPCASCFPEIAEADREAATIFQVCANQVIAGVGGVIDINLLTVKMIMDLYGIADQVACMDKVRLMFAEYSAALRDKEENTPED